MNYPESIQWLESVSLYGKKDGLNNMVLLMEKLGNVQKKLKFVHVAGTNGKGTICALLSSMMNAEGLHVGLFTSPHLVSYTERIQFNRETEETQEASEEQRPVCCNHFSAISPSEFARIATQVRAAAEEIESENAPHPTFFQLLTAIAFCAFARHGVDVVVLEVGVGGRLDATNIIEHPLACVIASISLDHTKVLGDTCEKIAWEKAGIIKDHASVVIGHNSPGVCEVISEEARKHDAKVFFGDDIALEAEPDRTGALRIFPETDEDESVLTDPPSLQTRLRGDYQIDNLRTAVMCARVIGLSWEAIDRGMQEAFWPGRMQWILPEENTFLQPSENPHAPWLLEGAHNEDGASFLNGWCRRFLAPERTVLVFSALRKKDIRAILKSLLGNGKPLFAQMIFGAMAYDGGMSAEEFRDILQEMEGEIALPAQIRCCPSLSEALQTADKETDPDGTVVIAGSLYLVGEVLELMNRNEE